MAYVTTQNIKEKVPQWQKAIQAYNTHKMKLKLSKAALLVIDMQNFFLDPKSPTFVEGGLAIIPNVQKLIQAFRLNNRPVIYTAHVHKSAELDGGILAWWWQGICIEGTPEAKIHPDIAPLPEEKVIYKRRYSAFYNTELDVVLRCLKIEDIVVSGIMTNICCESTTRDAYFRDYRIFFIADATGSVNEELHLATLKNVAFGFAYVATIDEIMEQIRATC
ncbi:MAG TPA: cysteine hydrolase [bacterium (Candidatus Stahlbacteria)]|nr:cysteine hydrolase [Candidatus Stahlbacteria bacterium]